MTMTTPPKNILRIAASAAAAVLFAGLAWYGYDAVARVPVTHVTFAGSIERIPPDALEALADGIRSAPAPIALASVRGRRAAPAVGARGLGAAAPARYGRGSRSKRTSPWRDGTMRRWSARRGEVFTAETDAPLPRFRGNDTAAPMMARRLRRDGRGACAAREPHRGAAPFAARRLGR
jgi:hypothetical protein